MQLQDKQEVVQNKDLHMQYDAITAIQSLLRNIRFIHFLFFALVYKIKRVLHLNQMPSSIRKNSEPLHYTHILRQLQNTKIIQI